MKVIGLIGGMSWESSALYYQSINRLVAARRGGLHSARCLLYSVDFAEIEDCQREGDWDRAGVLLADAACALQAAGADLIGLCTNTMHKVADAIQAAVDVPLLHIADATGSILVAGGLRRVGLLGTRFTMEQSFYRDRLAERFDLEIVIPDAPARDEVHRVIYDELCRGEVREDSRDRYRAIVQDLADAGAEGVILGCTEVGMLLRQRDATVPLFDTTQLHAQALVDAALS
ncbi:MAG TPA: aspartate/glutamate racemase family protein [Rhodanobacteraceae bacterium]|nr:aspartate/glutamate racemase family protein [Rhodanobacteraceae bacterium]